MFLTTPSVGLAGSNRAWTQQRRKFHCAVYTWVFVPKLETSLMNIFPFFSFIRPCQQKYLNATQTKNKLSPGIKSLLKNGWIGNIFRAGIERKVFFVRETKFDFCQSKYNFCNWIWSCFLLITQIADLLLWNQAVVFSLVLAGGNEFQQNVLD